MSKKIYANLKKIRQKLEEVYQDATIAPGEAIGVVTAESFGEITSGMFTAVKKTIRINELQILDKINPNNWNNPTPPNSAERLTITQFTGVMHFLKIF